MKNNLVFIRGRQVIKLKGTCYRGLTCEGKQRFEVFTRMAVEFDRWNLMISADLGCLTRFHVVLN